MIYKHWNHATCTGVVCQTECNSIQIQYIFSKWLFSWPTYQSSWIWGFLVEWWVQSLLFWWQSYSVSILQIKLWQRSCTCRFVSLLTDKPLALGFQTKLEFRSVGFVEGWKEPTTNSTHMALGPGIEPHWWEASALATALHCISASPGKEIQCISLPCIKGHVGTEMYQQYFCVTVEKGYSPSDSLQNQY